MKQVLTIVLLALGLTARAQGLSVSDGSVEYNYNASEVGDMAVSATAVTVGGKSYATNSYSTLYVTDEAQDDNSVNVVYNGTTALVSIAGNIADIVSAKVNGAHVTLLQSASASEEITYTLSGSSTNGSLYMDGKLKATFVLNGLSLHNPDSCAINIQDGKRIDLKIKDGTTNSLSDGLTGTDDGTDAHKAALYIQGHTEMSGGGELVITGNVKNGFTSHEYLLLKKSVGTLTITSHAKDCINCGEYYEQKGGTVTLYADADGGRALNCDGDVTVSGGYIEGVTVGGISGENTDDERKPHALATDGNIEITGGEMYFASMNNKSFKADDLFKINGGTLMGVGAKSVTPSVASTQSYTSYTKQKVTAGATLTYDGVSFKVPSTFSLTSAHIVVSGN